MMDLAKSSPPSKIEVAEKRIQDLEGSLVFPDANFTTAPLAVITCHFNWGNHNRPAQNLRRFVRDMERDGIPVYGVEAIMPGEEPIMGGRSRWKVIEVTQHGRLWQKEALLNAAAKMVPAHHRNIAALDADVWFDNKDWAEMTANLLEKHPAVQPFDHCVWTDVRGKVELVRQSAAKAGLDASWMGHPGFGWAFRREFFEQCGLYQWAALGTGDTVTAAGMLDEELPSVCSVGIGPANMTNGVFTDWRAKAREYMGSDSPGYTQVNLWHEWHGTRVNRKYADRAPMMKDFDAIRDIELMPEGWLSWSRHAHPEMMHNVANYFTSRKEDG